MVQSTNSHVRRLLNEKSTYEQDFLKAKQLMAQRMQGLLMQCMLYFLFPIFFKLRKSCLFWGIFRLQF